MTPEKHKKEMAIRKKKSLEGRKKKQLYHKVKKETLGHEEDNFSKLYVVKTQDGWYKMFDNSAFVYAYELAPRLEKQATVYTDTDYNYPAKYGVVSIKNFEELKKNMAKLSIILFLDS